MTEKLYFMRALNTNTAAKTFEYQNNKWVKKIGYPNTEYWEGHEKEVSDIKSAYNLFLTTQDKPLIFIHGEFIEGVNKKRMLRSLNDRDKGPKTIKSRDIHLFVVDVDGYKGDHDVDLFIRDILPEPFHTANYFYQYSSSYGLTDSTLKCHIFFWLDKSIDNVIIRRWMKHYKKSNGYSFLDPSPLTANQPVYIQTRKCIGAPDPIEDFYYYVEKSGNLNFDFKYIDSERKTLTPQNDEYNLRAGVEEILNAENFHNAINSLALSLINKKMPPNAVKELIKGAMQSVENQDTRWKERFDDIDRSVNSAAEIVNNPTIEEVQEWIKTEDVQTIKNNFAIKVLNLSPLDRTTALKAIQEKTSCGANDLKKTVKILESEEAAKRKEAALKQKSLDRQSQGIYEIEVTMSNRGIVAEKTQKILANSKKNPQVFYMAKGLVTVGLAKPATIRQASKLFEQQVNYPDIPMISYYSKPFYSLAGRIEQDVAFVDESGKDTVCPTSSLYMIGEGQHKDFKPLTGIVEAPFLDSNFDLVEESGYNPSTGLYTFLHDKLKITKIDSKKAYEYLCDVVLHEFPFASDLDRAVTIAAMMTCVQRPTIAGDTGFPGFGIISPTQSSGKTTLAQVINYSVFNRPVAATSLSNDEDEFKKHLLGILREGHSCIMFDNIQQGKNITSNTLGSIMSSDVFSHRQLGVNETISVPCSVVWLFTGNGISFVGDFATRVYPINIDAKMENPDARVFKREDIGQWCLDNRKRILSALLSIIAEGKGLKPEGGSRFKLWDRFVRQPLLKVSGIDINEAIRKNQQEDPINLAKKNFFHEIYNAFGENRFTTKELKDKAFGKFVGDKTPLGDATEELFGDDKRLQSMGVKLNIYVNQIVDGFSFHKEQGQYVKWHVKKINNCIDN